MDPIAIKPGTQKDIFVLGVRSGLEKINTVFGKKVVVLAQKRKVKKVMEKQARIFRSAPGIEG